jgi:hypothetical protein
VLLAFYDYPAEHCVHIRTTNPIESVFATVRLRHDKTKGNGSRAACLAMVYKADGGGIKGLALVERFAAAGRCHQGDGLHRRHPGEARRTENSPNTTLDDTPGQIAEPPDHVHLGPIGTEDVLAGRRPGARSEPEVARLGVADRVRSRAEPFEEAR